MNATAWVGVAALVVATVFNVLALRRSGETLRLAEQAYDAGHERYRQDRADARSDTLRDALIAVATSVATYNAANTRFEHLIFAARIGQAQPSEVSAHDTDRVRPAAAEVYQTAKLAHFLLEDEPPLREILVQIEHAVVSATQEVQSSDLSALGYQRVARECEIHRNVAATKASELLEVGKEAVARRRMLSEG